MSFYDDEHADGFAVQVPVKQQTPRGEGALPRKAGVHLDLLRRIETQCGEAESPGGTIRATVDPTGRVKSLWLDPRLSSLDMDELAAHIASTCAVAFDQRLTAITRLVRENSDAIDPGLVAQIQAMTTHLKGEPK